MSDTPKVDHIVATVYHGDKDELLAQMTELARSEERRANLLACSLQVVNEELRAVQSERQPRASVGLMIVWRYKDNKGWQKGYIKESLVGGKIIRITDNEYSSANSGSIVALTDIDWMRQ